MIRYEFAQPLADEFITMMRLAGVDWWVSWRSSTRRTMTVIARVEVGRLTKWFPSPRTHAPAGVCRYLFGPAYIEAEWREQSPA